jgi:lysozyme family protein
MEGGYSDDPYDPGGPTNQGITLQVFATYTGRTLDASSRARLKSELKAIRPDLVRAIYRKRYWEPSETAMLAPGLALIHFDAAVNHGVGTAIRSLQEALRVDADGEIGPITRAALAAADPAMIIERYAAIRERRYRALPHFWRFGRGWLRRVSETRTAALALNAQAARSASPDPSQPNGDKTMTTTTQVPGAAKWWGHSLTVWGAIVTAMAAILPALGPVVGLEITSEIVRQVGGDISSIVQAITGVIGTIMTLYGRARASMPLVRRDMNVRV